MIAVICPITCPGQIVWEEHSQNQVARFGFARIPWKLEISKGILCACCTVCSFYVFTFKDIKVLEEIQRRIIKRTWGCLTEVGQSRTVTASLHGLLLKKLPHWALRPPPPHPWDKGIDHYLWPDWPAFEEHCRYVQSPEPCCVVSSERV